MTPLIYRGLTEINTFVYGIPVRSTTLDPVLRTIDQIYHERKTYDSNNIPINPNTLGQFTGLKDSKGIEIFTHDIVKTQFSRSYGVIKYDTKDCAYKVMFEKEQYTNFMSQFSTLEVVGNIHQNPELVEEITN